MPVHKTISREVILYTLDEMLADEKLKKNVLDANREPDSVMERILEDKSNDLAIGLEKKGFQKVEIYYDLSYCQGSGACFDFNGCNILKIAKNYPKLLPFIKNIKWLFKDCARRGKINSIDSYCEIKTERNQFANLYCHEKTRNIDFNWNMELDMISLSSDNKLAIDEFQQIFRRLYIDICLDIRNKLRAEEEYYQSDEYTIELLKSNNSFNYFYENGTICQEYDSTNVNEKATKIAKILDNFLDENGQDNYVIINTEGKLFCNKGLSDEPRDGDFLDTSDEEDLGFKKAFFFTKEEALEFIVEYLQDKYDIRPIDKMFIKKGIK